MKKYLEKTILSLAAAALIGCGKPSAAGNAETTPEPSTTPTVIPEDVMMDASLARIYEVMEDSDYGAAMIFLGYYAESMDFIKDMYHDNDWLSEEYPYFPDIAREQYVAASESGELYCVIPCSPKAKVTVYQWILSEENAYMGENGEILYQSSEGKPFFLYCNVSDILPNSHIVIEDGEKVFDYVPFRSLEDGELAQTENAPYVLDLTQYQTNYTGAVGLPNEYVGAYEAEVQEGDGITKYKVGISFYMQGTTVYEYTVYNGEEQVAHQSYFGTWDGSADSSCITFDVTNDADEQDTLHFVLDMAVNAQNLDAFTMQYVSGDNILPMVLSTDQTLYFYPWYYSEAKG